MQGQSNRWGRLANRTAAVAALAALLGLSPRAGYAAAPSSEPPFDAIAARSDWYEDIMEALRRLYALLGGNPEELNTRSLLEQRMEMVSGYYAEHGFPSATPARTALADDIAATYRLVRLAPSELDPAAADRFRNVLLHMWKELGRDPAELD
jgi:hypothetical protein